MVLVDSCVLIDVLQDDPQFGEWSAQQLARLADRHELAVNPVVYAEIAVRAGSPEQLDAALPASAFRRLPIPYEAAFLAGRAFWAYRRRGGTRRSPLPDFFIGAHAAVLRMSILTRDHQRYRRYFPTVELITPG